VILENNRSLRIGPDVGFLSISHQNQPTQPTPVAKVLLSFQGIFVILSQLMNEAETK
jgi:hypothetical protein